MTPLISAAERAAMERLRQHDAAMASAGPPSPYMCPDDVGQRWDWDRKFHDEGIAIDVAKRLLPQFERLEGDSRNLLAVLEAHDVESLDCDRRGEKYCSCLSQAIERVADTLTSRNSK
jgi:hypothetical protein